MSWRLYMRPAVRRRNVIHECDEIVLWFGHGEYVDKAIALKCKLTGEPLPEISTVEQHRVEEEQRAAHEKQLTESIGAEMGIEGFAGADYEGSIDLDLIQRAMDGAAPEAADEPIVETAVTEDTLRDEVIVEEPVLEENEEPTLEENEESAGSAEGEETQDAAMAVDAGNTDSETVNADGNTADDDGACRSLLMKTVKQNSRMKTVKQNNRMKKMRSLILPICSAH